MNTIGVKKVGNSWVDQNNNSWDNTNEKAAIKLSKTLTDCFNCHNCYDCTNCHDCHTCARCTGCIRCYGCRNCETCTELEGKDKVVCKDNKGEQNERRN